MVNIPGSSRRCNECRRRRVRCGLEQPSCARCIRAGVRCSGPREGATFVRRDATNIHDDSNRKILIAAIRNEAVSPDQCRRSSSPKKKGDSCVQSQLPLLPASSLCSAWVGQDYYHCLVEDFRTGIFESNKNPSGQALQSAVALCAGVIIPLAFQNKALDASIFPALTMYLARLRGDQKLLELAISAYPSALQHFRPQVTLAAKKGSGQSKEKDIFMAISIALQLFEWLADGGSHAKGYHSHIYGALDLIKLSGPESFRTPVSRHVLSGVRASLFWLALQKRKATFLAEDDWVTIPYENYVKSHRELSLDLQLQIPGLLERADEIENPTFSKYNFSGSLNDKSNYGFDTRQFQQCVEFLRDADILIQKIDAWMESLQNYEQGALWWYSETTQNSATGQPAAEEILCTSGNVSRVNFLSQKIAGILIVYWTGLLELSTAIINVRKLFHDNALCYKSAQYLGFDSPSLAMPEDRPSKLALRVCQTTMYLSPSLEGCTIAYGAVTLAANHFRKELSGDHGNYDAQISFEEMRKLQRAQIGLECSKKGLGMLLKTMRTGQQESRVGEL